MSRELKGRIVNLNPVSILVEIPNPPDLRLSLSTEVTVVLSEGAYPPVEES